jgi:transposase
MITEISRAYKFRIYPNEQQQEIIQKGIDVDRFSFNHLLKVEVDTTERLKSYGYTTSEELKACRKKYKLYFNKFEASNYLTILSNLVVLFLKHIQQFVIIQ